MTNSPYTAHDTMCPNRAQWLRYRRGQSSASETRAIETHFTDCPLCSEAVETIMQTEPDVLQAAWEQIPNAFPIPPIPIKKATGLTYYIKQFSAAAAILVCVIGAYLLYNKTAQQPHQPIARNEANPPQKEQSFDTTTTQAIAITQTNKAVKEQATPVKEQPIIKESIKAQNTARVSLPNNVSIKEESAEMMADNNLVAAAAPAPVSDPQPTMKKALKNISADELASSPQLNTKTSGTELYLAKQYKDCIPLLENDIKENDSLEENALYLADAYLKTGNKRAARKLLQQIVTQNGSNAKQAQQMLDLLEKK